MFLLSIDAGLRAKEIAALEWSMITDAEGRISDEIRLHDKASKGKSGGVVYMSKRLQETLLEFATGRALDGRVLISERGGHMSAQVVTNWFFNLHRSLGFDGAPRTQVAGQRSPAGQGRFQRLAAL